MGWVTASGRGRRGFTLRRVVRASGRDASIGLDHGPVEVAHGHGAQHREGFGKLKDGRAGCDAVGNGVQVLVLAGARMAPVSEEQARPAVEQFLLEEGKRQLAEEDLKALRADAKIAYVGKFAAPAASGATPAAAGPGTAPAATGAASSPAISASEVGKGLGIK